MITDWKLISSKTVFDHPRMKLLEDSVELPDGKQIAYLREAPAKTHSVAVIAVNDKGEILLQREYNYPSGQVMYQLPGGSIELGEDVITGANRELSEESGYIGKELEIIGSFYLNNRRSDRKQYAVLCRGLTRRKLPEDAEEFIESEWIAPRRIKALIRNGKIKNAGLLAALTLLDASGFSRG